MRQKTLRKILFFACLNLYLQGQFLAQQSRINAPPAPSETWYVVRLGGTEVGYVREIISSLLPDETLAKAEKTMTETEMRLVLNRMGSRVELSSFSLTEEDSTGRLLTSRAEIKLSNQVTVIKASVREGTIELCSEAGGKSYTRSLVCKAELLGPEGIRVMSMRQLKDIGNTVSAQTFVAEASLVTTLSRTLKARETLEIAGRKMNALRIEEVLEALPTKRTLWLDEKGTVLKQEEPGPFGLIEVLLSGKEAALSFILKDKLPAEMYEKSIIRSNIRLPKARPLDRLKVKLIHRNPSLGWPELDSFNQVVLEKTEKTVTLEVRRSQPLEKAAFPMILSEENRIYLEPNAYLQSDDTEIRRLAHDLVAKERDTLSAALILERWVAENLSFDLGLVFAPASEIFRDRRGTCLGYATLLATLARAAGIPARVVLGYVYSLGMFGGHAWTEILAGKAWVPLDAAIVDAGPADAARIAILASSLAQGPGDFALGAAQQVFGQVDIEILEYEVDGKIWVVPEGAKAYSLDGNRYENPWLGVSLDKPDDFQWTKLDTVWPDRTLVGMEGPARERVFLEQNEIYPWQEGSEEAKKRLAAFIPDGQDLSIKMADNRSALAMAASDGSRAAFALCRGLEILILKVEAKEGTELLQTLACRLHIQD